MTGEIPTTEKLNTILKQMRWSQSEFADVLGVSQKTASFWLRGIKLPSLGNRTIIDTIYIMVMNEDLSNKYLAKELVVNRIKNIQLKDDKIHL